MSRNTIHRNEELKIFIKSVSPYDLAIMNNILGQNVDIDNAYITQREFFTSNISMINVSRNNIMNILFLCGNYVANATPRNSNKNDDRLSDDFVTSSTKVNLGLASTSP